jgi:hypothetical protein
LTFSFLGVLTIQEAVFLSTVFFYLPKTSNFNLIVFRFLSLFFYGTLLYFFDYIPLELVHENEPLTDFSSVFGVRFFFNTELSLHFFFIEDAFSLQIFSFFFFLNLFNFFTNILILIFSIKTKDEFSFWLASLHLFALYFDFFFCKSFEILLNLI